MLLQTTSRSGDRRPEAEDGNEEISMADKVIGRGTDHAGAAPQALPSLDADTKETKKTDSSAGSSATEAETEVDAKPDAESESEPAVQSSLEELSPDVAKAVKSSVEFMQKAHKDSAGEDKPEPVTLHVNEQGQVTKAVDATVDDLSEATQDKVGTAVKNVQD